MSAPTRHPTLQQLHGGRAVWDDLPAASKARKEAEFKSALRTRNWIVEVDAREALESTREAVIVEPRWSSRGSRTVTTASPIAEASAPSASTAVFEPRFTRARR